MKFPFQSCLNPSFKMVYCCHIWARVTTSPFLSLYQVLKHLCSLMVMDYLPPNKSFFHRRTFASLSMFCLYFHGMCSNKLSATILDLYIWGSPCHVYKRESSLFPSYSYSKKFHTESIFRRLLLCETCSRQDVFLITTISTSSCLHFFLFLIIIQHHKVALYLWWLLGLAFFLSNLKASTRPCR